MKKIIFVLIAISLATASYALTKSNDELMCYEPTPQFPGGDKACLEFIRQNIRYSDEMIKIISHLLDNPQERQAYGALSVEYVKKHYDVSVIQQKFKDIITSD